MKLTGKAIAEFLNRPEQCAGALLYGPDGGLARERLRGLMARLLPKPDPFALTELNETRIKDDPACVHDACAALSLTGGRQLVVLRDAGDKVASAIEIALPALADGNTYLLVTSGELTPRSPLRALFEKEPKLAALPCYKDEAMDLSAVIRRRMESSQLRMEAGVMEHLMQHLGNDRGVTQSELDKILLYVGEERLLTLSAARALVGHNRDIALDAAALALADRNPALLDAQLAQAFREGVQPIALLRAAQRHFQRLYQARAAMESGASAAQAVSGLKPPVFFRQVESVTRQVSAWQRPSLAHALAQLAKIELACKSASASPSLLCSDGLLALAAAKRLHPAA